MALNEILTKAFAKAKKLKVAVYVYPSYTKWSISTEWDQSGFMSFYVVLPNMQVWGFDPMPETVNGVTPGRHCKFIGNLK